MAGIQIGDITSRMFHGISGFNWIYLVYALIFFLVFGFIFMLIQDKKKYVYKVRIYQTRENGSVKELNYKGGYFKGRSGVRFYIKRGLLPLNKIVLKTTPNPAMMDFENRVYYKQIDVDTFIQLKRVFDKDILLFKPVEQDVKYGAELDLLGMEKALKNESTWAKIAPFIAMAMIFVLAIIGWWMVMDAKCPSVK